MARWRSIPGYSAYEVSDDGRVRRITKNGYRELKAGANEHGYLRIGLTEGKYKSYPVHRLMLLAFVGPHPPGKPEAAHKNGVRADNRLDNLYWASRSENCLDMVRHGTHNNQKLSVEQVREIKEALSKKEEKQVDIAKRYGVSKWTIGDIKLGKSWRHV